MRPSEGLLKTDGQLWGYSASQSLVNNPVKKIAIRSTTLSTLKTHQFGCLRGNINKSTPLITIAYKEI